MQEASLKKRVAELERLLATEQSLVDMIYIHLHKHGWIAADAPERFKLDPTGIETNDEREFRELRDRRLDRLGRLLTRTSTEKR